jgi:hypothetical protein
VKLLLVAVVLVAACGWGVVYRRGIKAGMRRMKREIAENRHIDLDQRQLAWTAGRDAARFVEAEPVNGLTTERPVGFHQGYLEGVWAKERAIRGLRPPQ